MRKTAMQVLSEEGKRVLEDVKKLGYLAIKHPDPVVRKAAASGASKLWKLLAALGVTGAGVGGGLMAADRGGANVPPAPGTGESDFLGSAAGIGNTPETNTVIPPMDDYESPDFDTILREQLPDYADMLNQNPSGAATPGSTPSYTPPASPITEKDFELPDNTGSTENYDKNAMNVEMLLDELQSIDERAGNYSLPENEMGDLAAKREALMKRLEQTGFSEASDNYTY